MSGDRVDAFKFTEILGRLIEIRDELRRPKSNLRQCTVLPDNDAALFHGFFNGPIHDGTNVLSGHPIALIERSGHMREVPATWITFND